MKSLENLSEEAFANRVRQALALPDAPEALVRSALALWRTAREPSLGEIARGALNRVLASLSFDSWATPALAAGVRGVPGEMRHLMFSAEGRGVDLRVTPSGESFVLAGQILGPDETGLVELTSDQPEGAVLSGTLDELGEFRLEGVPAGHYEMVLRLGGDEIVLPPIEVRRR